MKQLNLVSPYYYRLMEGLPHRIKHISTPSELPKINKLRITVLVNPRMFWRPSNKDNHMFNIHMSDFHIKESFEYEENNI